ncbi:hypothetical protein EZ449_12645 [Pedobacter frigidisoli]|uniref:Uncharacterized protein n=1 Tax=Pedobacter frigidisoli TaxID=2530455 RepID=A0A4R0P026_9SPHI|nr:hypothetical protein [Pedobacter frigidisoli]TCD08251.1 hypothetical protein EZ449_12645 [Pedobacter frigidisoli]
MDNQSKDQAKSKIEFTDQNKKDPAKGLDNWNDRLDENLESNDQNDTLADEKAKDFSEKLGSGDQSTDANN